MQYNNATNSYVCTECDKKYMNKSVLKRHMAIHREEKLIFNCNEGDYICDNKRNFTNHVIMHSLEKTFT